MTNLLGYNLVELQALAEELGAARYVGKQLADWLYKKRVCNFDDMLNLSKSLREKLKERYVISGSIPKASIKSEDGTEKYLFDDMT